MSRRSWIINAAAATLIIALSLTLWAQDRQQAGGQPSPEQLAEMMKAWQESITPGEGHRKLEPFVGKWKTITKVWYDPAGEPMVTEGEAEAKWILGGRYIRTTHKGKLMAPGPDGAPSLQSFEGEGMMGFNNARQVYEGTWADTMSTSILTYSGTASGDGKTFRMYGKMDEPMLGVYGRHVKYVDRIVDENTIVFELYDLAVGDNHKVLEVTYKRQ